MHTDTLVEALGPDSGAIRVDYRSGVAATQVLSPWCVKGDDGLDAGRPAEDQVRCLLWGVTPGDER